MVRIALAANEADIDRAKAALKDELLSATAGYVPWQPSEQSIDCNVGGVVSFFTCAPQNQSLKLLGHGRVFVLFSGLKQFAVSCLLLTRNVYRARM